MNQALYAHMNNNKKKKKNLGLAFAVEVCVISNWQVIQSRTALLPDFWLCERVNIPFWLNNGLGALIVDFWLFFVLLSDQHKHFRRFQLPPFCSICGLEWGEGRTP
jgi:hypothetical protein